MVIKISGQNYLIKDHLYNFYHYKKLFKKRTNSIYFFNNKQYTIIDN